jgi:hypothetical protein
MRLAGALLVLREHLVEERAPPRDDGVDAVAVLDRASQPSTEPPAQRRVLEKAGEGVGDGRRVALGDEQAALRPSTTCCSEPLSRLTTTAARQRGLGQQCGMPSPSESQTRASTLVSRRGTSPRSQRQRTTDCRPSRSASRCSRCRELELAVSINH